MMTAGSIRATVMCLSAVGGPGNDLIAIAVGLVAYLALAFAFHPVVIGVPVVGA